MKEYIKPQIAVMTAEPETMLAGSIAGVSGTTSFDTTVDTEGTTDTYLSREITELLILFE